MNKCLKITFNADVPDDFIQNHVLKNARKLNIEGTAQTINSEKKIKVIVCGDKDEIDQFLDLLHKSSLKAELKELEIEPFLKDKDYRGVFRVIE